MSVRLRLYHITRYGARSVRPEVVKVRNARHLITTCSQQEDVGKSSGYDSNNFLHRRSIHNIR